MVVATKAVEPGDTGTAADTAVDADVSAAGASAVVTRPTPVTTHSAARRTPMRETLLREGAACRPRRAGIRTGSAVSGVSGTDAAPDETSCAVVPSASTEETSGGTG